MGEPDTDYPDLSHMTGKGSLPRPRQTKASRLQSKQKLLSESEASAKLFKMKRFQKIQSKLNLNNEPRPAPVAS